MCNRPNYQNGKKCEKYLNVGLAHKKPALEKDKTANQINTIKIEKKISKVIM